MAKCFCGSHELTRKEEHDLPHWQGITFCFTACIDAAAGRWQMDQRQFSFDMSGGANDNSLADGA